MRRSRRDLLAAVGTAAVAATAGCSASAFVKRKEKTVTGTLDAGDAAEATVRNELGDLTVRTERRSDVRYRALKKSSIEEKNFDELVVRARQDDDTLTVEGIHKEDGTETKRDPQLDLAVWVPESLAVTGVDADVGDVTVTGTTGDLSVTGTTADVVVDDVDGDVSVDVGTGDVEVTGATGVVGGSVDTGDLTVSDPGGAADLAVDTGDLTVDVPAVRADTTVEVGVGDLTAHLGDDLDAELVASADTGDVDVQGLPVSESESSATGTLGEGSHDLTLTVDTGDVSLRPL